MSTRHSIKRQGLLIGLAVVVLFLMAGIGNTGTVIDYTYDENGNLKERTTGTDGTTPPTGSININSGVAFTNNPNVTLNLSCSDTGGCTQMHFSNDNVNYSNPEPYSTTKAWTLFPGDGQKTVYVIFKGSQNNWSPTYSHTINLDTTPPTSTATPSGGTYLVSQSVALSCNDGSGSGCYQTRYTTNGSNPNGSSPLYSAPINITLTTTLKFFSTDLAGNAETFKTENYIISPVIMVGGGSYLTIQDAYNAASNGSVIKCQALNFTQNLTVNRNISVTLEGGYNPDFSSNAGGVTNLKGSITTTTGGGTITITNFVITQ